MQSTTLQAKKRTRIAVACTSCRGRKSRCNGGEPSCRQCSELGVQCVYERLPRKQIKPPKKQANYRRRLRALEDTVRDFVQNQHPMQHAVLSKHDREPNNPLDGQQEPRSRHQESRSPVCSTSNSLEQNGDEDTVDGMATVTSPKTMNSMVLGPSSNIAFLRQVFDATAAALHALGKTSLSGNALYRTYISSDATPVNTVSKLRSANQQRLDSHLLPSDSHARHLIRLFFSNIGMLFPVVHESECLRVYCTAKMEGSAAVSQSWLCLLNVIFALGTCASTTHDGIAGRDEETAEVFIEKAEALAVHITMKSADLKAVQCLLLIAQYCQGTQRPDEAWHLHGLAVRAAIQLGLHWTHTYTHLKPLECELRKRTWFGCVILDRMLSMTLGRPCTISDELLQLDLPVDIGLDAVSRGPASTASGQSATPNTVCLFIATIQLYDVLGDIIKKLYGSNVDADVQQSVPALLGTISHLEHKLEVWKQNLPPQLQQLPLEIKATGSDSPSPAFAPVFDRLSVILTLRYLNTRILLHRPILSACLRQRYPFGAHEGPSPEAHGDFLHEFANVSIDICERSAVEVIDIVCNASRQPGLLGTWWFTAYYTYNAALVIFCCILLHTTTPKAEISFEKTECHEHANHGKIVHLQRAIEATARVGAGSVTAKKIELALLAHRQTCMALVRSDAGDDGREEDTSESFTVAAAVSGAAQLPQIDGVHIPHEAGVVVSSEACNVPFLDFAQDDPFATLDEGMDQPWSELDWFSDVFGPNSQLEFHPMPSSSLEDSLQNGRYVGMSVE
ncbi:uncharacterized protein Z520_03356 [Fonsecaea multimorphosa CBS 102226]|uniref:Zn(2)-C6 fungal-type domain-containing protein n=1 Tax=Fonsecaea multimorphosa CBS 102226 TaxID=1442371 RepID=A0A0D2HFH5_9EURO|nr:uncharacterized protein Z520_03356 [Fonsecaea multimorphosa CBS 102226]KIY00691.1 hypothetical protein Z520_03356 [Fonsecaea multimorphosa CBS 102226]